MLIGKTAEAKSNALGLSSVAQKSALAVINGWARFASTVDVFQSLIAKYKIYEALMSLRTGVRLDKTLPQNQLICPKVK